MYFPDQKVVFVHVPKTGGNFFSRSFLQYSGDHMRTNIHQDGVDRFGVRGDFTMRKHQPLSDYVETLGRAFGADLSDHKFFAIARHPVDRLLSYYFSPHRWLRENEQGEYTTPPPEEAQFTMISFERIVVQTPSLSQIMDSENCDAALSLKQPVRHNCGASIELLAFDDLQNALGEFAKRFGFDAPDFPDRPVNASAYPKRKEAIRNRRKDIEKSVIDSAHAADLAIFAP